MISLFPARIGPGSRLSRRDMLRIGLLGSLGTAMPEVALSAPGGHGKPTHAATAKSCIYIFLCGGPSQLDMWDPKPHAPAEIRGPFRPIPTNVPGIQIGDLLPQVAGHADKLAIIRSVSHDSNVHDIGILYTLLGTVKPPSRRPFPPTRSDHPGFGAVLQSLLGNAGELPAWVVLPRVFTTGAHFYKGQTAGFLGPNYDPFALDKPKRDSLAPTDLEVQALALPKGIDEQRVAGRRRLLQQIDLGGLEGFDGELARQVRENYDRGFSMLSSGGAKRAFDLRREPPTLRERYGLNEYGQSFLLARRLVEAGVRMVNLFWTFYGPDGCQFNLWDNHGIDGPVCGGVSRGIDMIKHDYCCPSFDRAFAALLEDLHRRGLLDETLVVVIGEFGRTPKINKTAGRDHWGPCYSAVLAGGGVRGGQVFGASDRHAAYVTESPVSIDDLTATIYHAFGLQPETPVYDQTNRPVHISQGEPLTTLF